MPELSLLVLAGCGATLRTVPYAAPSPAPVDLDAPGPITHRAVVSARWEVPLGGLLDLDHPAASELENRRTPIVLPVHVLVHPTAGTFVVDTGVPRADLPTRGLVRFATRSIEPVTRLADILEAERGPLAGVLLTHGHVDHVLGLVDVAPGVPIHAGPGEEAPANFVGRLTFPAFRRALDGRPLTTWDWEQEVAVRLGQLAAIDILGDGSIYAIDASGHTPGSTAYLVRTADGPVLFTGDCSHTRWGWDHGVPPGTYTVDHEANQVSLDALRALAAAHPAMKVFVGHEL